LSENNLNLSFGWDFKTIIGILLSIIGLVWAFHDFQFKSFSSSVAETKFIYIIIACISILFSVWLRAIRWRLLINSDKINIKQLYNIEMVGYFGNNVLPLRAGEIYRGVLLSNKTGQSKSYSLGTIALERMTDMMGLIILFGLLFIFYPLPADIKLWGTRVIIFSIALVFIMLLLKFIFKSKMDSMLKGQFISQFLHGLTGINFTNFLKILGWTLIIWFVYWLDTHLIQYAFDLNMTWEESLLVLVLTSVAMAIPSAPGMIGTYHAAVKFTMVTLLNYDVAVSNAFSIILHAYGFLALTGVGAYFFLMSFKKINERKNK